MIVKYKDTSKGHTYRQWIYAILANVTVFSYGLQCGWISAMAPVLQSVDSPTIVPLTDPELSLLASAPSFAAMMSVTPFAFIADRFGRKKCIMLLGLLQTISWAVKLITSNLIWLIFSQICSGMAGGSCFNIIPMYVKEISDVKTRGPLGVILVLAQSLGILTMYGLGGSFSYYTVLWAVSWISPVTLLLTTRAPESPAYLYKIGKLDDAALTIAFLRGVDVHDKNVQSEIESIKSEDDKFKSIPRISFFGIFKERAWRNGFVFMILIMMTHELNGAFCILTYASIILLKAGVTINAELLSLCIPTCMIFGTLLSMTCVERLGRKAILAGGFGICMLSFCGLSAILIAQDKGVVVPQWAPLMVILVIMGAYAAGVSPMPVIRGKVLGCLVTSAYVSSFIQIFAYEPITSNFGAHVSFLCFAAVNLFGFVCTIGFLPETKGKSVEQIEIELEKKFRNK